jgi:hypothetical protein
VAELILRLRTQTSGGGAVRRTLGVLLAFVVRQWVVSTGLFAFTAHGGVMSCMIPPEERKEGGDCMMMIDSYLS